MYSAVGDELRTVFGLGFDHLFSTTTPHGPRSRCQSPGTAAEPPFHHLGITSALSFSLWVIIARPWYRGRPLSHDQGSMGLAAISLVQWQASPSCPSASSHHFPTLPDHMDPATLVTGICNHQLSLVFGQQPMLTHLKGSVTRVWTPSAVRKRQGT